MTVLNILQAPNDKLSVKAQAVTDIGAVQSLIDDMLDTMYDTTDGIGLAATQVGRSESIIVIDISATRDQPIIVINPELVFAEHKEKGSESCLSVPGYSAEIERFRQIKVTGLNRMGDNIEIKSEGFLAIVLQHEIDHIKGILFIDYLSALKRKIAIKKASKHANTKAY